MRSLRIRALHQLAHERRVERAEPLERPQRMDPRELIRRRPRHRSSAPARPTCPASGRAASARCRATSRSDVRGARRAAPASRCTSAAAVDPASMPSYVIRQMRPQLCCLSSSYCSTLRRRYDPGPTNCASWMMPVYMSIRYNVPSGALTMQTGRKSGSVERMNSDFGIGVAQLRQAVGHDDLRAADDARRPAR